MSQTKSALLKNCKVVVTAGVLLALLTVAAPQFYSRDHIKSETIEATAMGTGTQMGANVGVTLDIYDYSTPEDRQVLVQAFEKGQTKGL